jgi:hypothetical protein
MVLATSAPAAAFQNEPTGFRGLLWGADFASVAAQMRLTEDDGGMKFYSRAGDPLKIGAADLKEISYGFYKGQLSEVIASSERDSDEQLIEAFTAQFGKGQKPNQFMRDLIWQGSAADAGIVCNDIEHTCAGVLNSVAMKTRQQADKAAAAAGAGKDF